MPSSSADKYQIMCGAFCAYIAKPSKRNPNRMLEDRRKITDGEMMYLMDWLLDRLNEKGKNSIQFESKFRDGRTVELHYLKKDKETS